MEYESLPSPVSSSTRIIRGLASLPTEIILIIFSHSSWDELLTSWWSVNKHLDAVICSMFFTDQLAITLHKRGLSSESAPPDCCQQSINRLLSVSPSVGFT